MKLRLIFYFSFLLFSINFNEAKGAACCGGGFAIPSIITGDDKAQLTTSLSFTEVVVDNVDSQGIWRNWDEHQNVQVLRIEGGHIFDDLWQVGFSLPVIQRVRQSETHSGLGDISINVGYEYLSDWNYNPYRPKGIAFVQLIFPTGRPRAESEVGGLDSRGNGFWALGAGTVLTKSIGRWDAFTSIDFHRSFEKRIRSSSFTGTLKPGLGGNLGLGLGYNMNGFRLGSSITWTQEDPILMSSNLQTDRVSIERFATTVVSLSHMTTSQWSGTLSYTDQTLFGDPQNTSLGRGILFQFQKRWAR
ncbi:MAG: hypothetical protein ACK5V3_00475 [Bdellovibrionales bacterium]